MLKIKKTVPVFVSSKYKKQEDKFKAVKESLKVYSNLSEELVENFVFILRYASLTMPKFKKHAKDLETSYRHMLWSKVYATDDVFALAAASFNKIWEKAANAIGRVEMSYTEEDLENPTQNIEDIYDLVAVHPEPLEETDEAEASNDVEAVEIDDETLDIEETDEDEIVYPVEVEEIEEANSDDSYWLDYTKL